MTRSKAIARKVLFFCRPSIPVHFNEPVHYAVKFRSAIPRYLIGCLPAWFARPFMTVHVSERIVEIPFVFSNLRVPKGSVVVDVGCVESRLSLELANLGYKVLAVDIRPYEFCHPNLKVIRGDFVQSPIDDRSVDAVVAVSTLEHLGLPCYSMQGSPGSDLSAMEKIRRILRPGGQLILTVPYGQKGQTEWFRVYDHDALQRLLEGFAVDKLEFYERAGLDAWKEIREENARGISSDGETNCVALVSAFVAKQQNG